MCTAREGTAVGAFGAYFVLGARWIGINLVAAEDQHAAGFETFAPAVEVQFQRRLGQGVGDRVRGIPAIAGVGDVVEPEIYGLLRVVELRLRLAGQRLDESRVGVAAEDVGDGHLVGRMHEHARVVPPDHRSLTSFANGHHALRKVSTGGWFTTDRVASHPASDTSNPPPTRP